MPSPTHTQYDTNINLGQQASSLSSTQNDWNPSGTFGSFGMTGVVAVSSGLHVTGLAPVVDGRLVIIATRDGAGDPFTLDHLNGASTNRFYFANGSNQAVKSTGTGCRPAVMFMYDGLVNGVWFQL